MKSINKAITNLEKAWKIVKSGLENINKINIVSSAKRDLADKFRAGANYWEGEKVKEAGFITEVNDKLEIDITTENKEISTWRYLEDKILLRLNTAYKIKLDNENTINDNQLEQK